MDLRQIEVFRAVARHGGFSRAARALRIGQPSLTRSVARLETDLGFRLFQRGQGAARLTPEGSTFLREVERSFIGLDRLRLAAQDIRNFGTGRLRVAALTAVSSGLIPRALRRFIRDFPEATVALQIRPSTTVYDWVATGQCELGVAASRTGFNNVEEEPFYSLPGVIILPSGHRLTKLRRPLTPHDLRDEPFLSLALDDDPRRAADGAFEAFGLRPRTRLETQYSATLCALVGSGLGVALVNPLVAADYRHLPIIVRPFSVKVLFTYHLLRPRDRGLDRLTEAFVENLHAELAQSVKELSCGTSLPTGGR